MHAGVHDDARRPHTGLHSPSRSSDVHSDTDANSFLSQSLSHRDDESLHSSFSAQRSQV
jgi:hypothetical protein